ncbi:hypothetical protein [Kaarinaea lacus]
MKNKIPGIFTVAMCLLVCACSEPKITKKNYPDADSQAAVLYISKCGQCHAAPLPDKHTANIWPAVLERMKLRMISHKVRPLTEEETVIVLEYLQTHAKAQ